MKHGRTTTRRSLARTLDVASVAAGVLVAATVFVLVLAAVVFLRPTVRSPPRWTAETVGGLHYSVDNAWILDPSRSVDAPLGTGLPPADRRPAANRVLYAVFVGVTNETGRRLPMATDIALQDTQNREYAPVSLGPSNAYAYRPRVMAPQTHQPAPGTAAARDVSAEGSMLVFRIPRQSYVDGALQLVVRDPAHPASVSTIEIA
jgi:hypothetical protein